MSSGNISQNRISLVTFDRTEAERGGQNNATPQRRKKTSIKRKINTRALESFSSRTSEYTGLNRNQKLAIVMNDEIQWEKLMRALRDSARVTTHTALLQVIDPFLDARIKEMETFQIEMRDEESKNTSLSQHQCKEKSALKQDLNIAEAATQVVRLVRSTSIPAMHKNRIWESVGRLTRLNENKGKKGN